MDEFLKHLEGISEEEKHHILTLAVAKLYNTVSSDDILKTESGVFETRKNVWTFEGRELTSEEVAVLRDSAKSFLESRLFKVLEKEIAYQANKRMFFDSQSTNDLIAGKLMLFLWDVIKTRLDRMSQSRL